MRRGGVVRVRDQFGTENRRAQTCRVVRATLLLASNPSRWLERRGSLASVIADTSHRSRQLLSVVSEARAIHLI
ncbi:hypothetical protein EVAR_65928_1 [Eumeta japonica]|uniref:Uncharacterized protein n=1 Tax=Eumeta variegata TaxID=151549 RepID=A0A4C2A5Q9_EUMVA|nr:hypothetical protein EVAR_65928_1 [Eumeta japonica]